MIFYTESKAEHARQVYGGEVIRRVIQSAKREIVGMTFRPSAETIKAEARRRIDAGDALAATLMKIWDNVGCPYHDSPFWGCTRCALNDMEEGHFYTWGLSTQHMCEQAHVWLQDVVSKADRVPTKVVLQYGRREEVVWEVVGADIARAKRDADASDYCVRWLQEQIRPNVSG